MYLIAGLGNPGKDYEDTRHNIGYRAVEAIAKNKEIEINKNQHRGLIGSYYQNGEKILLVKPTTYMNLSGLCIKEIVDYYKIPLENVLVVYDDIDFDVGEVRIRANGSAGTHNGMRSIIDHLNDDQFARIRIGIGKKPAQWDDLADYVLSKFLENEKEIMAESIKSAAKAVDYFINKGIDFAMNRINKRKKKPAKKELPLATDTDLVSVKAD